MGGELDFVSSRRLRLTGPGARALSAAVVTLHLAGMQPLLAQASEDALATADAQRQDARLAKFFEGIFQRDLARSPMLQAQLGIKGADYGSWDDASDAEAARRNEFARADLARLRAEFDLDALNERSKVSYRVYEFLAQRTLDNFPWRFHGYVFSTVRNPVTYRATFLQNVHSIGTAADAEAYVSRLARFEFVMAQVLDNIDAAAARGIISTPFAFDPVLRDTRALLAGAPFDSSGKDCALLADFRAKVAKLDIPAAERERLIAAAVTALSGPFRTALQSFISRVESLRAQSRGPHGVWKLPDGARYYRNRIAFWTSDPRLTADEIHRTGLAEVARLRAEMAQIMKSRGFKGDLKEFFAFLRADPGNFFPDTEEGRKAFLAQSRIYVEAIDEDIPRWFNTLPKAPLEVRRVEEWRQTTEPFAFYERPSPDGSRPGIYYVNLRNMANRPKHEMETLAYHEGAPGHHLQIAIQQEIEALPAFQKFAFFSAYSEGWACYTERLAKEQGRYTDPLQDFGRLQFDMLRAARLVVDTGAHSRKWTRDRMIAFMTANTALTLEEATREVDRYIDLPGQALAYKVGTMKILSLRERAREALRDRFDIREFHDAVLKHGAVALPILEELVEAYIASQRK